MKQNILWYMMIFNSFATNILRLRQNGCQFAKYILKFIFLHENCCILIKISLKFVPSGLIDSGPINIELGSIGSDLVCWFIFVSLGHGKFKFNFR